MCLTFFIKTNSLFSEKDVTMWKSALCIPSLRNDLDLPPDPDVHHNFAPWSHPSANFLSSSVFANKQMQMKT